MNFISTEDPNLFSRSDNIVDFNRKKLKKLYYVRSILPINKLPWAIKVYRKYHALNIRQ